MAKKYHPDFQGPDLTQKQSIEASEMFKKVQKAYEVLSNPISRQAYDIEMNLNTGSDGGGPVDQNIYEDQTSKRSYFQPKQQKDFYYTKWTGYRKPDWYHPYNGLDARSEFLYLRRNAFAWPWIDKTIDFVELNRLFFYCLALALFNLCDLALDYRNYAVAAMELDLLRQSFQVEQAEEEGGFLFAGMLDLVKSIDAGEGEDEEGDLKGNALVHEHLARYIQERRMLYQPENELLEDGLKTE